MRVHGFWVLALLTAGCDDTEDVMPAPPNPPNLVEAVGTTAWSPSTITIRIGESVAFRNPSNTVHNVRFAEVAGRPAEVPNFASGTRLVPFPTQGTYSFHCGIHPVMQGQIRVVP